MTETQFIEQNKATWQELELLLTRKDKDPDELHDLFVKVSSDLAYASTFYPKRSVRAYLNQLTQQVFDSMETKKTEWNIDGIKNFFSHIMPVEMYRSRKALLSSFLIFALALIIGIVSSANNLEFVNIILGDDYVNMTNENINNGDPMAVYKGEEQSDMFLAITVNNVRVSFIAFIFGIMGTLGTIVILMYNGIMVGAFQYFFYAKGLFLESFLTIWIHGTIEISAIIIAGAAGIVLGNGLLFPKTYKRSTSLQISARRAVRIILGTLPLFIIAGFLESFVTRLTDMPTIVKILIIGISLAYILAMYVIYPRYYYKYILVDKSAEEIVPDKVVPLEFQKNKLRTFGENISLSFSQYRNFFGLFFSQVYLPLAVTFISLVVFYQLFISTFTEYFTGLETLMHFEFGDYFMFLVYWILSAYVWLIVSMIYREEQLTLRNKLIRIKYALPSILFIIFPLVAIPYFVSLAYIFLLFLFVPPMFFIKMINQISTEGGMALRNIGKVYTTSFQEWIVHMCGVMIILTIHSLLYLVINSSLGAFIFDFFYWHEIFEGLFVTRVIIMTITYSAVHALFLPLYYFTLMNYSYSNRAKVFASDLWERLDRFNQESTIFESAKS